MILLSTEQVLYYPMQNIYPILFFVYFNANNKMCCIIFRYRLASGTSEKIQLSSMISAFQVARNLVTME